MTTRFSWSTLPIAIPLLVAACGYEENPLVSTGTLRDLETIPQDAKALVPEAGLSMPESAERRLRNLRQYWYAPWERTQPTVGSLEEFGWAAVTFAKEPAFGPNLMEVTEPNLEMLVANAQLDSYPSRAARAIAVRNSSLRALPSSDPIFRDFRRAGEGYPFDYNQNSAVWAGTPLLVTHRSLDGRFVAAESPYTCGWIDPRDIAYVDDDLVARYRSLGLAAIVRDRMPISAEGSGFLFQGRVGMLLPMETADESGASLLAPVADENKNAAVKRVPMSPRDSVPAPLSFSGDALAGVINEIVGQPYGWGGLGGYRDCSSTVLDVLLPFGLPLPRNTNAQVFAGRNVSLGQLEPSAKEARILDSAAPFRTLLNMPGHVLLYLGAFEGVPVAFHTIWGLRTESGDGSNPGRHVIGRSVITSLSPGAELKALSRTRGDLLSRIESFTVVGEHDGE